MSAGIGKCSKIRHIVRLRQMLRRWRSKAQVLANRLPSDVPAGHVAVCVGSSCKRFVVRATYLNHPTFKDLLVQAQEEYGFTHQGPLLIPCEESVFEEVIRFISRFESRNSGRFPKLENCKSSSHVGVRSNLYFWSESRPLLPGLASETICDEWRLSAGNRVENYVGDGRVVEDICISTESSQPFASECGLGMKFESF